VGDPDLTPAAVTELQEVLVRTGALAYVEDEITALATRATDALTTLPLPTPARTALVDLADFVVARDG
jgi:geranylgeranyl pyrophosphate synthase